MTTGFQRSANTLLKDGGYTFVGCSGKAHEVWRKDGVPDIHVPGTPSGGRDSMLARVRRAIRKGTALTPPSGQEIDVAAPTGKGEAALSDKLVEHASAYLKKKAEQRRALGPGEKMPPDKKYPGEITKWMRRCIETHGAVVNSEISAAAKVLGLDPVQLSHARRDAGCVSYRTKDMPPHQHVTDFIGRVPEGASVAGGATAGPPKAVIAAQKEQAKEERKADRKAPLRLKATGRNGDVEVRHTEPAANGNGNGRIDNPGRPLEQGGLTPEQHDEAEQRMLAAHVKAEEERQAIIAQRGGEMETVAGETNGNGTTPLSGVQAALNLLLEEALATTFSLTEQDILTLKGQQEMHRRHAEESTAAAGAIGLLLKRVAAKKAGAEMAVA